MLSKVHARTVVGMESLAVEVEVDVTRGMPKFHIVGLADTAVQESKQRVFSAIRNTHYTFPPTRITVNLAPADIRKSGPLFDLSIAIGILMASEQIPFSEKNEEILFLGELALDGRLRHISGVLPLVSAAEKEGITQIFVSKENAKEAALVENVTVYGAEKLSDVIDHLNNSKKIEPEEMLTEEEIFKKDENIYAVNFSSIVGQEHAKRALEIAAAGSHNVLMNGSPGSGKTFMAKAFPSILPRMVRSEAFEVSEIYSIAGMLPAKTPLITQRPFRTVHHTASSVSIVGGGRNPSPGEISLAHRGVLFMDEIAEFPSQVLEVLRQPLEDRKITVSRATGSAEFPAHFSLIAAMNPCPCGYYMVANSDKQCICSSQQISRYQKKLSGPLLDRIDLHIDISHVDFDKLQKSEASESSKDILKRVQNARDMQTKRFKKYANITSNAEMGPDEIKLFCVLPKEAEGLLRKAVSQFSLSARSYHRILKVSRSIADIEKNDEILLSHVAEALQYRCKKEEV